MRQNNLLKVSKLFQGNTAAALAKQHGVSRATIVRDGQFAAAVEKLEALDPEITKKVTKGEAPARIYVIKAAKLLDEHPEKAAAVLQGKVSLMSIQNEIKNEEGVLSSRRSPSASSP
jgi:hypothetical protein